MTITAAKRLAAGMAVACTVGLVAGCGNITTPSSTTPSSSAPATTSGTAATPAPASSSSAAGTTAAYTDSQLAGYYAKVGVKGTATTVTAGKTVQMTLGDFYFQPNTLTVAKGTKVTIAINNPTVLTHSFTLAAFGVDTSISPSGTATVTFTPTKAGTYYWYCKVPGHASLGMVGKLTVQ